MDNSPHWDPVTRELLEQRVAKPPACRFFDEREQRTLGALFDVILAQDAEPRVPVLADDRREAPCRPARRLPLRADAR